ncbi:MAG: adenosylmethionine decarboxylase [Pirellulales bacterium]|nr:adenosylmethionine decarboxylase [Pirellulales bacterium]
MYKGRHLLIDCRNVPREVCLDDRRMLDVMARAASKAGANVISQVRYHFGHNSPPGFTAVVVLDESHASAHCYADSGQIAMDVFTCGNTDPREVLAYIREQIDLGDVSVREELRFLPDVPPLGRHPCRSLPVSGTSQIDEQKIAS